MARGALHTKSSDLPFVIPAEAGMQGARIPLPHLEVRFRGYDGISPDVTIDESVSVLRQANLSFPRTRNPVGERANECTRMDARLRGHDDSRESLRAQLMTLGKGGTKPGAPALAKLRRRSVLRPFVTSGLGPMPVT